MRETRADNTQALLYSLALHVLIFAVAFIGLWWTRSSAPLSAAGPVIEAELIDPNALSASMQRALRNRPEPVPAQPESPQPQPVEEEAAPEFQPEPEPVPQDSPVPQQQQAQERVPEPDTQEQERVSREAIAQETREREQEEKRRQEQIDLTEREKQAEAERKQRLRAQLEEIRKEREAAERRTKMEEQRLQQLADAQAKPAPNPQPTPPQAQAGGNNGTDTDLAARYALAMHQTANAAWNRALAPERVPCKVRFTQIPGGEVINVQFLSCGFDDQARESVERALRRGPMPYAGFEPVFSRQIDLTFCHPEEACPR